MISQTSLRRFNELKDSNNQSLEEVEADMRIRDQNDTERALAPLKPAEDAIIIDTTRIGIDDVVDKMLAILEKKL